MMDNMSSQELQLCEFLREQPRYRGNRYTPQAENDLIYHLFWSLAGGQQPYFNLLFPNGQPATGDKWLLRKEQGGEDGDEFTEAARGKACGHIFKAGEATYRCKTCSADDTCVLCSRCYDSSDHTGHMVYVSISLGNSGCCDCGDPEAWRIPVHCSIHTDFGDAARKKAKGKAAELPQELVDSIRMTIGRTFDYICDVISCSPEQLRLPKSKESILEDEKSSRLGSEFYNGDVVEEPCEYALLLWNDEKHTVYEVRDQVARACKTTMKEGLQRAHETDDVGRSIVKYSFDIDELLRVSQVIEQIKVTVTIRSARDTFREQMCGSIIEWLSDIAGCSVGQDHDILRQVICEEMLKKWSFGSSATNRDVGMNGIDDHEMEENRRFQLIEHNAEMFRRAAIAAAAAGTDDEDSDDLGDAVDEGDNFGDNSDGTPSVDEDDSDGDFANAVEQYLLQPSASQVVRDQDGDTQMTIEDVEESPLEHGEATEAGFPPPPPPPPAPQRIARDRDLTPSDSDTAEMQPLISEKVYAKANMEIPKTPRNHSKLLSPPKPARYWLETSPTFKAQENVPLYENLQERLRLDWMILFDLRMWKKVRIDLRDLYIATVVTIPEFKRVLGLRFAGLYTTLAQLYLIADREPDHSIINISLQMLTTPTITSEIVERGNFLTNLMAILYTFLTTRQVGHPHEISPNATLAFDSGSVTNRRMYHFFLDLKYLSSSEHIQEKLRREDRYMLQFLDLVKLHQGICPNTRAVGDHVEYETDAWISASLITREINRLCRQFSESFQWSLGEDPTYIQKALRLAAKSVILNSLGAERKRFDQAEIKDEVKFKKVGDYEFDTTEMAKSVLQHSVVKFVVESQPISFHHALHYTLSWLVECGRSMSPDEMRSLLSFTTAELLDKPRAMGPRVMPSHNYTAEDHLIAAFDYPLRVCAWLAQMKASMWVRNGMSLRHQHSTYRGVNQRDVCHHRDIFLLQTAMVVCPPARVLVSMIDRYGLEHWMKGIYEQSKSEGVDDGQVLDVAEDLIHLLIVLISDRTSLVTKEDEPNSHILAMRRDITHVLCFKPLSFTEICNKLPDKFQDQEECQDILDEMTTFKPPEGLSDVGSFELKEQYLEDVDPYISHYTKNQREESENAYKAWLAKKTGRPAADIVFEPKLRPIESGTFSDLSAFTRTGIFAQIIYYALLFPLKAQDFTPTVPVTRVEAFLQVVLHLVLIAILEDKTDEDEMSEDSLQSFVYIALTSPARSNFLPDYPNSRTIAAILEILSRKEEFKACHPKIALVLKRMKQKRPRNFDTAFARLGVPVDRISTASPANSTVLEDREKKKQAAMDRQAKVMAQFQQQQKNFLANQGDIDWGEDGASDIDVEDESENHKTYWPYPTGTCILCQEETKDGRLYGTFALITPSTVLRQTPFGDPDFVREVLNTPANLDHSADSIRPCGVAGENREEVHKVNASGVDIVTERQFIGKGFPAKSTRNGPVSVGCGHIMHYKCFEVYYEASQRRHQHQIARHHPEVLEMNEFVCPLCKALGNSFLPIIWTPKEEIPIQQLQPQTSSTFDDWLYLAAGPNAVSRAGGISSKPSRAAPSSRSVELFMQHNTAVLGQPLASKMSELLLDAWEAPTSVPSPLPFGTPTAEPVNWARMESAPLTGGGTGRLPSTFVSPMSELVDIYQRLRDSMVKNKLESHHPQLLPGFSEHASPLDLSHSDSLAKALGFSISAVEIQQRGVGSSKGSVFIDSLPQQALSHLRILSETVASYISIGGIRYAGDNRVAQEFSRDYELQHVLLYLRPSYPGGLEQPPSEDTLLTKDIFTFLTECSICLARVDNVDIMHLVRLCYLAELVKVIVNMGRNQGSSGYSTWIGYEKLMNPTDPNVPGREPGFDAFADFCITVRRADEDYVESGGDLKGNAFAQPCFNGLQSCLTFVRRYALAFLRKVVILLHVRCGLTFANFIPSDPEADELDRLTEALKLPTFDQMCASVVPIYKGHNPVVNSLVKGWIQHSKAWSVQSLTLSHPAIFELLGLPKNFDTLIEETMKRRCPTTGKEVSDPMLCLFCGEIFCGQGICCLKPASTATGGARVPNIGGAQQHLRKCQNNLGLLINIRKCCVFYLYHLSGSWMVAPYIDRYGEVDPGLRHSRQLFLNQKRYDALLRTVWLSHGIPSVISRKLEMDINNGGWETI